MVKNVNSNGGGGRFSGVVSRLKGKAIGNRLVSALLVVGLLVVLVFIFAQ